MADFLYGQPPAVLSCMKAAGAVAVARYVASTSFRKTVTAKEARLIAASGLGLVTVFEWGAKDALGGVATAQRDRQAAMQVLAQIGQPQDRPLYVAVDFEPTAQEIPLVRSYLATFADGLGWPLGVYGAPALCGAVAQLYGWLWVAGAWPGTVPPSASLYQRETQVQLCGVQVDRNEALRADFGQW